MVAEMGKEIQQKCEECYSRKMIQKLNFGRNILLNTNRKTKLRISIGFYSIIKI